MSEAVATLPKKFMRMLETLLYIASHAGPDPVSGKEICAYSGLSQRHLEPLLQKLVHHRMLRGTRGPKGGYSLAKERRKITLGELYSLMGDLASAGKAEDEQESLIMTSVITPLWKEVDTIVLARLNTITLEDLCNQMKPSDAAATVGSKRVDTGFTI